MEYVWERTDTVLVNEKLLQERECTDGRHDGEESGGASGARDTAPPRPDRRSYRLKVSGWAALGTESRPVPLQ